MTSYHFFFPGAIAVLSNRFLKIPALVREKGKTNYTLSQIQCDNNETADTEPVVFSQLTAVRTVSRQRCVTTIKRSRATVTGLLAASFAHAASTPCNVAQITTFKDGRSSSCTRERPFVWKPTRYDWITNLFLRLLPYFPFGL